MQQTSKLPSTATDTRAFLRQLSLGLGSSITTPILRSKRPLLPGQARFAELLDLTSLDTDRASSVLDQAVVTYLQAPHAYTSEDVVEISLQAYEGAPYTPHEMLILDMYEALRWLDEFTGDKTPDSILNEIFSTFCIGK